MSEDAPRRLEVNWVQTLAGALAAVTSAVLLSTVGVAGTLIGAALGSLVLTVGNAVYSYYLDVTKERVAKAQAAAAARMAEARRRVNQASREVEDGVTDAGIKLAEADEELEEAQEALDDAAEHPAPEGRTDWREVLRNLPWKRIAIVASAIFVLAMLIILAFELITGRAVSSYTGGSDPDRRTSIPGFGGGGSAAEQTDQDDTGQDSSGTEQGSDSDGGGTGSSSDSDDGTGADTDDGTGTSDGTGARGSRSEPSSTPTATSGPSEAPPTPDPVTTPTEVTTPTQQPLAPETAPPSP